MRVGSLFFTPAAHSLASSSICSPLLPPTVSHSKQRGSQQEKTGYQGKFCSFTLVQSILLVLGIPESALDSPATSMMPSTPASATPDWLLDYLLPCSSKVPTQCLSKTLTASALQSPFSQRKQTINFLVVFQTQQIIKLPVLF